MSFLPLLRTIDQYDALTVSLFIDSPDLSPNLNEKVNREVGEGGSYGRRLESEGGFAMRRRRRREKSEQNECRDNGREENVALLWNGRVI